jgi:hypothetical protein
LISNLLYALGEAELRKQRAAQNWRAGLWKSGRGRVSSRVLGEFHLNPLRLLPEARDEARAEVRDLLAWESGRSRCDGAGAEMENPGPLPVGLLGRVDVAGAKAALCRYLLTEDLQAGQKVDGIEVVNPFIAGPESI